MKKFLFIASLILFTIWLSAVFIFRPPLVMHALLPLSVIIYIRALMHTHPESSILNNIK